MCVSLAHRHFYHLFWLQSPIHIYWYCLMCLCVNAVHHSHMHTCTHIQMRNISCNKTFTYYRWNILSLKFIALINFENNDINEITHNATCVLTTSFRNVLFNNFFSLDLFRAFLFFYLCFLFYLFYLLPRVFTVLFRYQQCLVGTP